MVSFRVVDRDGLVLTDGTATNVMYGERAPGPLPGTTPPDPMLIRRDAVTEAALPRGGGRRLGRLGHRRAVRAAWEASLRRLRRSARRSWQGHRASLLSLGALVLVARSAWDCW